MVKKVYRMHTFTLLQRQHHSLLFYFNINDVFTPYIYMFHMCLWLCMFWENIQCISFVLFQGQTILYALCFAASFGLRSCQILYLNSVHGPLWLWTTEQWHQHIKHQMTWPNSSGWPYSVKIIGSIGDTAPSTVMTLNVWQLYTNWQTLTINAIQTQYRPSEQWWKHHLAIGWWMIECILQTLIYLKKNRVLSYSFVR